MSKQFLWLLIQLHNSFWHNSTCFLTLRVYFRNRFNYISALMYKSLFSLISGWGLIFWLTEKPVVTKLQKIDLIFGVFLPFLLSVIKPTLSLDVRFCKDLWQLFFRSIKKRGPTMKSGSKRLRSMKEVQGNIFLSFMVHSC